MFRNRAIRIKMVKEGKDETSDTSKVDGTFEKNAYFAMQALESLGAKMFLGVCVYILLDTHRQVAVAKVIYNSKI